MLAEIIVTPIALFLAYEITIFVWGRVWMVCNKSEYPYFPIGKLRLMTDGIEYGEWWYFYWWCWLPKNQRYWGYEYIYYDGPHYTFGLWFTNITWRFPWSKDNEGA